MSRVQYAVARREWRMRDVCEDAVAVNTVSSQQFVGVVADGHANSSVSGSVTAAFAAFVSDALTLNLSVPELPVSEHSVRLAFGVVTEMVRLGMQEEQFDPRVGAVVGAVCLDVLHNKLTVAHAGDVRLYANVRAGKSFRCFTQDHSPKHPAELERLGPFLADKSFEVVYHSLSTTGSEGPYVSRLHYKEPDGSRSLSGLMVTRGFGDEPFQPALVSVPDVQVIDLNLYRGALFALCSDGARRNVGRLFQKYQSSGLPGSLEPLVEAFYELHEDENEDDASVLFFRLLAD